MQNISEPQLRHIRTGKENRRCKGQGEAQEKIGLFPMAVWLGGVPSVPLPSPQLAGQPAVKETGRYFAISVHKLVKEI
jgi:hypothetical protein